MIDLSYGAAQRLGMKKEGLAKVCIEMVQTPRAFTRNPVHPLHRHRAVT
jgi:rare lipoprotein A (peptidoglycan hydrolase)